MNFDDFIARERLVARITDENGRVVLTLGYVLDSLFHPDPRLHEVAVDPMEALALASSLIDHAQRAHTDAREQALEDPNPKSTRGGTS